MKKKILIVYATYGTGHKVIAKYIENYFKEKNSSYEVLSIDLLLYSIPILGKFTQKASNKIILSKNPYLWSIIYNLYNNKFSVKSTNKIFINLFKNKKLINLLKSYNPDLTISTHFWASSLITNFNKKEYINSKLITIVTDYQAHEFWLNNHKGEDALIVSGNDIKNYFISKGVDKTKIFTYGIPISNEFNTSINNKIELYKQYKIDRNKLVFLFFGGGGLGSLSSIPYVKTLFKLNLPINIIFVSGMNKKLKLKVKELSKEYQVDNITVLGFVNNVPELLKISDAVITKPGGVTITECISEKKPMILFGKKGGNELGNTKYIIKKEFGINVSSTSSFKKEMIKITKKPKYLNHLTKKLKNQKDNKSISKLYKLSKDLLEK
ncbi:MAG: glycosyltransferase [Bacilli bacterium]